MASQIMVICIMEYYATIKMTFWGIFNKSANYSQHRVKGEKSLTQMQNYTCSTIQI